MPQPQASNNVGEFAIFHHVNQMHAVDMRWLQEHDRHTGDLPGMLILAHGMPVALTDHIDRSPDKLLLRGRVGHVHSWIWAENDRLPTVVYVKFPGATWKLNGIDEPGVYPIQPVRREWYLDKNRKPKVLKVIRRQLPLTPAFAMTAHASQGKTLRAVLLDLNVDKRVDTTFGTVAASRVCDREDVLILRPFRSSSSAAAPPKGRITSWRPSVASASTGMPTAMPKPRQAPATAARQPSPSTSLTMRTGTRSVPTAPASVCAASTAPKRLRSAVCSPAP